MVCGCNDNRTIAGAAVIGADGLRSTIRQQILDEGEPRTIGYVAHRTIVPMADVRADVHRNEVVLWSGPGFHIVHYPLRNGTLFNIVAVFRTATFASRGNAANYRAELNHTYRDSHPSMKLLLAMMDMERRWVISDRDPTRRWSKGRLTLLGDAAHPTLQTLAQGACMAIEDAVCLAELIDLSAAISSTRSGNTKARDISARRVCSSSPAICGTIFITSAGSNGKLRARHGPPAPSRTCSGASLGSMSDSRCLSSGGRQHEQTRRRSDGRLVG
jgi:2-polyprenyl-6-methoxyphenol hydroxylase-like FAD-dependent oxidoreductase